VGIDYFVFLFYIKSIFFLNHFSLPHLIVVLFLVIRN
jgi:hypothetical protein